MYRVEFVWKSTGELQVVWCHSDLELVSYIKRADYDGYLILKIERNDIHD